MELLEQFVSDILLSSKKYLQTKTITYKIKHVNCGLYYLPLEQH